MRSFSPLQILWVSLGLFAVACDAFTQNEVYALNTFKEAIYEDPNRVLSNWNALDPDPCDWSGISCSSARDHVIKLNLSGSSLKGFLTPELNSLSSLQELILHGNGLIGTIPREIGLLKHLKVLDLGANKLSGSIPQEIGNLTSIETINLQSNGLTGRLPSELGNLKSLKELFIDRNKLKGNVPGTDSSDFTSSKQNMYPSIRSRTGLCCSSHLKNATFSYNFFVGTIPKCLEYLPRSSFQGNCLHERDLKQRPTAQCGGTPPKSRRRVKPEHKPKVGSKHQSASKPVWLLALEIVTGTMVGTLFLVILFTAIQKYKSKSSIVIPWKKSASEKDHTTVYIDSDMLKNVLRFSRQELEVACEDFSNIIGSSPDNLVYKGTIKGGSEIAVVSLSIKEEHWTDFLELYYQKEVEDLARLNHDNMGKLLGYCSENSPFTRMLVFEYASNGTLYEHLHYEEGCQLSWTRRMNIIIGIARGLKYLHTELEPPFTISDLSSSSVYLTDDFSPKLVDFESWKGILSRSEKNSGSFGNGGAIYVLPNSLDGRNLDLQGNIYALGVLLLEIVSGRPPYSKDKGCLVDWAKDCLEWPQAMSNMVDPELKHFRNEDLKVIYEVVMLCVHPNATQRTSMKEVCTMLESGIDTSISTELKASSLAWAELALST